VGKTYRYELSNPVKIAGLVRGVNDDMSLSNIIHIATSGVLAQQTAIAATSENVANITTPDFARREIQFQADAIPGQFSGVTVEVARSAANNFLQEAVLSGASDVAALNSVAEALLRVVGSLGEIVAAQTEVIGSLDATFSAFQQTQTAIVGEVDRAITGLGFDIDQANELLSEVFVLNNQIAVGGKQSNGPRDALGARLSALSGLLNVDVARDDIGRATVTTGEGRVLVNASGFARLSITEGTQARLTVTGLSTNSIAQTDVGTDITTEVSGGSIGGALSLISSELPALAVLVQETETNFVNALNAASAVNTSFPPPQTLTAGRLPTDAEITGLTGRSTLALLDTNGILLGKLDLDFDTDTLSVNGGAAIGFLASADGLAEAINVALGGNGSATIIDDELTIGTVAGQGLAFADDTAGLAELFGFNAIVAQSETGFGVVQELREAPALFVAGRLTLVGANLGDVVASSNDGSGAARLFEAGRSQAARIAGTIGEIGARANAASGRASVAQAFNNDINARLLEESGVNLEQELSNLILFQRAFNANARILSVADELYQSVLALI